MNAKAREEQAVDPEIVDDVGPAGGSDMVELLRGGAAIAKVENESLMQMAITRPRDVKRALTRALDELDIDPEFASKQWYSIPYLDRKTGQKKPVEGLTVKAAMALGRCWGNCTITARLVEETDTAFIVEGVAVDLETLFRVSRVGSVSKFYKAAKSGKMQKWSEDRFPQLIGAAASKQARNAALAILPESVRMRYWNHARKLAADVEAGKAKKSGKTIVERIVESFAPLLSVRTLDSGPDWKPDLAKVKAIIEDHLGHELSSVTKDEAADLKGILNALESGEAKPWEVFAAVEPPESLRQNGGPGSETPEESAGDLFGGSAR